jgi:fructokinase
MQPGASKLFEWAKSLDTSIIYDPNVRHNAINSCKNYQNSFVNWAKESMLVKLSEQDLKYLGFSVQDILNFGVELLVLTHGEKGISAYTKTEEVKVPGEKVEVSDTVGAGDTVTAVLIEALVNFGKLNKVPLLATLSRAARAAAITCSRVGAQPPTSLELNTRKKTLSLTNKLD